MNRSCDKNAEQEVHFRLEPVRVAPLRLVANPFPDRARKYAPPHASWLQAVQRVEIAATSGDHGISPYGNNISTAELERAIDFIWTLNCCLEKRQVSVLQVRRPFPPRLSRYLLRARSGLAVRQACSGSET